MIRPFRDEPLTDTLTLTVVEVTESGRRSYAYEVVCSTCGEIDIYSGRSAAETYGPCHSCAPLDDPPEEWE